MTTDPLPRDVGSRLGMGCLSIFGGFLFASLAWGIVTMPEFRKLDFWPWLLLAVVQELVFMGLVVMMLLLLWALAAPRWVESLFEHAIKKLWVAIGCGCVAVVAIAIVASALRWR